MNPIEWKRKAEFAVTSAEIEDVRLALIARLEERYGIKTGILPLATGELNHLTEPLLGVTTRDAQCLAALACLQTLDEQFVWMSRYFAERLNLVYHGSRTLTRFVDKMSRTTLSCAEIAGRLKATELRVGRSLAQRVSSRAVSTSSAVASEDRLVAERCTGVHEPRVPGMTVLETAEDRKQWKAS